MALRIHTNLLGLFTARELGRSGARSATSMSHIASGLRLTSPGDDPQGLARAERAGARLGSTGIAIRNAEDAIGLVRTLEAGLAQMFESGVRLRELALQAANGTTSAEDLALLDQERLALAAELTRIAASTRSNGIDVLGVQETIRFQIGIDAQDALGLDLLNFKPVGPVFAYYSLLDEEGVAKVHEYSGLLLDFLAGLRGFLGTVENRLGSIVRTLRSSQESLSSERTFLRDADLALEASSLERDRLRLAIGALLAAQANVNHLVARDLLEGIAELRPGALRDERVAGPRRARASDED